jgi:uncharacterized membrane protein
MFPGRDRVWIFGVVGITANMAGRETVVARKTIKRYRKQHVRMVARARWHRITGGGFFPSAVAAGLAMAAAVSTQMLELRYSQAWCGGDGLMRPLCEIPMDMSVSLQAGVGFGVLGTVGIVFSILLVSLQLVSGQFSPRLVQAVFRDKRSKSLIALLVGVFVFAMASLFLTIVLAPYGSVPGLSTALVGTAGILAGIALVMMLYGIAQRQYIGSILDDAAQTTIRMIRIDAKGRGAQLRRAASIPNEVLKDVAAYPEELGPVHVVMSRRSGWVQQLTSDALLEVAPDNCVIRLETRVGAFIPQGAPLASVWPLTSRDSRGPLTAQEKSRLDDDVNLTAYIGGARTMQDDVDFGLRQITDVFLRAMSSAVNDPSTAIEALMSTTTVLRAIVINPLPHQIDHAPDRHITVLRPWDLDAEEYLRHGLDQIRLVAVEQPATAIALLRVLTHLIETADLETRKLADISDEHERVASSEHLRLARKELEDQRRCVVEAVESAGFTDRDRDYVRSGLAPQRPDLLGDYPQLTVARLATGGAGHLELV